MEAAPAAWPHAQALQLPRLGGGATAALWEASPPIPGRHAACASATLAAASVLVIGRLPRRRAWARVDQRLQRLKAWTPVHSVQQLPLELQRVLDKEAAAANFDDPLAMVVVENKEGPGPIQGALVPSGGATPCRRPLREMAQGSADLVVEAFTEELSMLAGHEAWQCHFYPLGGHAFSLARSFIVNLASVAKVLRPGGKFLFRTRAGGEEVVPFAFLRLRHLLWDVRVVPGDRATKATVVVCTLREHAHEALAAQTPAVVAEECEAEESRSRYFAVLRPLLRGARRESTPLSILDVGGGDGSLAAWFYHPEVISTDGPYCVTLMEENPELADRARQRLPIGTEAEKGAPRAHVAAHAGEPWPFADGALDVVVLAFLLHHARPDSRGAVLREARRVARDRVLVLEDQPSAAAGEAAKRLAWLVTEEHFRPFGQEPAEFLDGVMSDEAWRREFRTAGLEVEQAVPFPGTLRHPVPHVAYHLAPAP